MKRVNDIIIDLNSKEYRELTLKQMDSTQLVFTIVQNGEKIDLNSFTANLIFTKPNGTVVLQEVNIDSDRNVIVANLLKDCVRDYGKGRIEIELLEAEEVISSFQLFCKIEKTGKDFTPSSNNDSYYERAEKILSEVEGLINKDFGYEKYHNSYRKVVTEEISKMTEYTLPCSYMVGNDSLVIFYNSEKLLCEKNEEDVAHYKEIGEVGTISNKVMFGWDIPIGRVFDFIVKGEYTDG